MMLQYFSGWLVLAGLGGCEELYDIESACHDKLVGGASLDDLEYNSMLRVNCYRRLTGVTRATANELVQLASDRQVNYVQQNPDWQQLISDIGPVYWLNQEPENPGFSGNSVFDRLTGDELTGGAGYTIFDVGNTGYWEFIAIDYAESWDDLKSGPEAIDELMRYPVFRQSALQPSWIDGAYSEGDLEQQWFVDGGFRPPQPVDTNPGTTTPTTTPTTEPTTPVETIVPVGRVYYMLVVYQAPHFEHVDKPVLLPVPDQTDVPWYSWSQNRELIFGGQYAPVQVSYPVTLTMGAIDPTNYTPIDQNQYSAQITGSSIVGPDGPLEIEVVHPGDDPEDVWPSGQFQRTTLGIFARKPFTASTRYDVFIDLVTKEGQFAIDFSFTTRDDDPGLDLEAGLLPEEPGPTPTARRMVHNYSLHTPPVLTAAEP